jgi:hypothetical protein
MSIKRLNEFPDGSGSLTADDVFLFMDDPSGGGVTKKISLSQISSAIVNASEEVYNQEWWSDTTDNEV